MRDDHGHAPVELALGVGLLLFPVAILVLSFGPWSESRVVAEAAAAEAARAAVLAGDVGAGEVVVGDIAVSHDLGPEEVRIGWCGAAPNQVPAGDCSMNRGSVVSVEIRLWTPLVATPFGDVGGVWVTGQHAEPVDLYRSIG